MTNSITSFSAVPLRMIFYTGLVILACALLYAAYLVFHKLILATPMDGWTSVMVSIWLLGGLMISFIGLIGIYLSKVFSETKERPSTIVREIYGQFPTSH
jgi:putative glycosyltransferase